MSNIDIALVLDSIRPGAAWRRSDTYDNLVATWEDTAQTCPTWEEIEAAWVDIQKQQQIDALNAEYLSNIDHRFEQLKSAYTAADINNDADAMAAIQTEYQTLLAEYNQKMEAIIGD